jgi:hypothetical protein
MDAIDEFKSGVDAATRRRRNLSSVADIAAALDAPAWHIYKIVLDCAAANVGAELEGCTNARRAHMLQIVASALSYAKDMTREDGLSGVWTKERLDEIKFWAGELSKL